MPKLPVAGSIVLGAAYLTLMAGVGVAKISKEIVSGIQRMRSKDIV